jgi:hypothetical protein
MKYIVKKQFAINDTPIGNPGDTLEIKDAVPTAGEGPESVEGYCDIENLTTGEKFEAAWMDIDDSVEPAGE